MTSSSSSHVDIESLFAPELQILNAHLPSKINSLMCLCLGYNTPQMYLLLTLIYTYRPDTTLVMDAFLPRRFVKLLNKYTNVYAIAEHSSKNTRMLTSPSLIYAPGCPWFTLLDAMKCNIDVLYKRTFIISSEFAWLETMTNNMSSEVDKQMINLMSRHVKRVTLPYNRISRELWYYNGQIDAPITALIEIVLKRRPCTSITSTINASQISLSRQEYEDALDKWDVQRLPSNNPQHQCYTSLLDILGVTHVDFLKKSIDYCLVYKRFGEVFERFPSSRPVQFIDVIYNPHLLVPTQHSIQKMLSRKIRRYKLKNEHKARPFLCYDPIEGIKLVNAFDEDIARTVVQLYYVNMVFLDGQVWFVNKTTKNASISLTSPTLYDFFSCVVNKWIPSKDYTFGGLEENTTKNVKNHWNVYMVSIANANKRTHQEDSSDDELTDNI